MSSRLPWLSSTDTLQAEHETSWAASVQKAKRQHDHPRSHNPSASAAGSSAPGVGANSTQDVHRAGGRNTTQEPRPQEEPHLEAGDDAMTTDSMAQHRPKNTDRSSTLKSPPHPMRLSSSTAPKPSGSNSAPRKEGATVTNSPSRSSGLLLQFDS